MLLSNQDDPITKALMDYYYKAEDYQLYIVSETNIPEITDAIGNLPTFMLDVLINNQIVIINYKRDPVTFTKRTSSGYPVYVLWIDVNKPAPDNLVSNIAHANIASNI